MTMSKTQSRRIPVFTGLLIVGALLSAFDFLAIRHLYPVGANDGAAAGWWWCLSFSWVALSLERSAADGRPMPITRWYFVAVFTALGLMEVVQHGVPAGLGFLVGAGTFSVVFALTELVVRLTMARSRAAPPVSRQLG